MNIYKDGLELLCALGVIEPLGHQVLLKAVKKRSESPLLKGTKAEETDDDVCHEVVKIGSKVTRVSPGQHCLQISTAATPADFELWEKKRARYCFVHEDDIVASWDLAHAEEALKNSP